MVSTIVSRGRAGASDSEIAARLAAGARLRLRLGRRQLGCMLPVHHEHGEALRGDVGGQACILVRVEETPKLGDVTVKHLVKLLVGRRRVGRTNVDRLAPDHMDVHLFRHHPRQIPPAEDIDHRDARERVGRLGEGGGGGGPVGLVLAKNVGGEQGHAVPHRQTDEAQTLVEDRYLAALVRLHLLGDAAGLNADVAARSENGLERARVDGASVEEEERLSEERQREEHRRDARKPAERPFRHVELCAVHERHRRVRPVRVPYHHRLRVVPRSLWQLDRAAA
mmetsp:Transcript_37687/g.79262  ORF Transcript_37687/g.79262 Transcript_37687/m.79262 type:complete len:281 (+) Transcript_37687:676-1518(+)